MYFYKLLQIYIISANIFKSYLLLLFYERLKNELDKSSTVCSERTEIFSISLQVATFNSHGKFRRLIIVDIHVLKDADFCFLTLDVLNDGELVIFKFSTCICT